MAEDSFPNQIRSKRLEANLSQAEVAAKLGISQAQISNWENGKGGPDEKQIAALSSFLGPMGKDQDAGVSSDVSPYGVWLNSART